MKNPLYLGTAALEIYRWAPACPMEIRPVTLQASEWAEKIAAAGFDGVELWEQHSLNVSVMEKARQNRLFAPLAVYNTYLPFDNPRSDRAMLVAERIGALGARKIKYNLGRSIPLEQAVENLRAWCEYIPEDVILCNECHGGCYGENDEEKRQLARLLPEDRFQNIVHLASPVEFLQRAFDALDGKINHCHAVFCATVDGALVADDPAKRLPQLEFLKRAGFDGTFTLEFVAGAVSGAVVEHPNASECFEQATKDAASLRKLWDSI